MFSQLAKRSARVLPADLCTDRAHYVKNHRSTVLRKNKNMAVEGGTVSHYYILVIRSFIDFMLLFRHSVWFFFFHDSIVLQFPKEHQRIEHKEAQTKYRKMTRKRWSHDRILIYRITWSIACGDGRGEVKRCEQEKEQG